MTKEKHNIFNDIKFAMKESAARTFSYYMNLTKKSLSDTKNENKDTLLNQLQEARNHSIKEYLYNQTGGRGVTAKLVLKTLTKQDKKINPKDIVNQSSSKIYASKQKVAFLNNLIKYVDKHKDNKIDMEKFNEFAELAYERSKNKVLLFASKYSLEAEKKKVKKTKPGYNWQNNFLADDKNKIAMPPDQNYISHNEAKEELKQTERNRARYEDKIIENKGLIKNTFDKLSKKGISKGPEQEDGKFIDNLVYTAKKNSKSSNNKISPPGIINQSLSHKQPIRGR